MVDWRALEAKVDQKIGATFGEEVRHLPQENGTTDPGRPIAVIRGVLHTPTPAGTINIGGGVVTSMSASEGALVVERALYPDVVFRPLDRIVGIDLPGNPQWEVRTVNDRFSSIIVLVLNQK